MYVDPEVVEEYLNRAGDIEYCANSDRKMTTAANHLGRYAALRVGDAVNASQGNMTFNDTLGHVVSRIPMGLSKGWQNMLIPEQAMVAALAALTGKPVYKQRAFELKVTLDLEVYKAVRRVLVPADIGMVQLHDVLQTVFGWDDCHLHEFDVLDKTRRKTIARVVMDDEDLFDDISFLEADKKLSDFFPECTHMLYTYDLGDDWEHDIELVNIVEECNEKLPYLLEAVGQTPPEDVGGVGGFVDFREAMLDPTHPEHAELTEWVGFWSPELSEREARPRAVFD